MDQFIQVVPKIAENLPAGRVDVYVRQLARKNRVQYKPASTDALAATFARLSDAEHNPDEIEHLLLALSRAGIITRQARFKLHTAYLKQIK